MLAGKPDPKLSNSMSLFLKLPEHPTHSMLEMDERSSDCVESPDVPIVDLNAQRSCRRKRNRWTFCNNYESFN